MDDDLNSDPDHHELEEDHLNDISYASAKD
jgi:hypothetical protein